MRRAVLTITHTGKDVLSARLLMVFPGPNAFQSGPNMIDAALTVFQAAFSRFEEGSTRFQAALARL
jgi:hypothetical protein